MASHETSRAAASDEAAKAMAKMREAEEMRRTRAGGTDPTMGVAGANAGPAAGSGSDPAPDPAPPATASATAAGSPGASVPNGKRGSRTAPPDEAGPSRTSGGNGRSTEVRRIGPRRPQFMIATRQTSGLQPLSADLVEQQLRDSPDIEFVKRIEPPHVLDLQSAGGTTGSIMLARMDFDKAQLLQTQAGPRATVERDLPLTYSLDPGPAELGFKNPGVLVPHAEGFETTIEVTGDGRPLAGAEVYIFGSVWPAQGVTDASGRCTLSILGENPDTIRAVYVKPKIDYWSFWLPRPQLVPNSTMAVEVKPLSAFLAEFPDRQLIGWGGKAMGLDKVPLSMNGAGVKVAIIDSGAAQQTHRNLHHTGPGLSVVGPDSKAWTEDIIGHGSHCAGIIGGGPVGPDGVGVRGFAPNAEIHICRIFPGGRFSDLVSALDYCMENGIDVVNMSLGGGEPSQIIEERLIRAKQMGVACIVAAGNSGGPVQFPASTPHTLAVAAIGKWGEFPDDSYHAQQALDGVTSGSGYFPANFSCFGPEVDVCGPGVAIVSSLPPDGFGAWDGTSMATPHITGLAALVLAHHPDFKGSFRNRDARRVERLFQIIKETAAPISVTTPDRQGAGLPYAPRALGLSMEPATTTMAGPGAMPTDASIEALKKLLALIGAGGLAGQPDGGNQPQAQPQPQSASPAVQPASVGPSFRSARGEPWSNGPTSRGAANVSLAGLAPWPQTLSNWNAMAAGPVPGDAASSDAFRQAMARGTRF
jgi:subtilisin family serine protease